MSFPWPALHAQLLAQTNRLSFHRQYQRLQCEAPELPPGDVGDLLRILHDPAGDADPKNRTLRALIAAGRSTELTEASAHIVLLALWPGLEAVRWRLRRAFPSRVPDLDADLVGALTLAIRSVDLGKVNRVAATLLRNLERDLRREMFGSAREAPPSRPVEEIVEVTGRTAWSSVPAGDPLEGRSVLKERLVDVLGLDAELLLRVAVDGDTQSEAAAALGISHDAARKRYQRALFRLRGVWPA